MSNSNAILFNKDSTDVSSIQYFPTIFSASSEMCNSNESITQTRNFELRRRPLNFEKNVLDIIYKYKKEAEKRIVCQLENEIRIIIQQDEFIDGEISSSELYIRNAFSVNQLDSVLDALMKIYSSSLLEPHILEGVLVMISCVPYEAVQPEGQVMAMGLLSNKELVIRDRAIQCFERWNSKKGLTYLKSLDCHPKWLQSYVEKVIMYIERNGMD